MAHQKNQVFGRQDTGPSTCSLLNGLGNLNGAVISKHVRINMRFNPSVLPDSIMATARRCAGFHPVAKSDWRNEEANERTSHVSQRDDEEEKSRWYGRPAGSFTISLASAQFPP